ncbi:MAG: hypothetical protein QF755_06385 [Candidatus Peribacteraceae bacterium]|jgi:hypothetical protein|nr:hypothetical protein [Candidatus Peribacteraceae bacterium]HCI04146.1 hypothetical protein [Candidatus Peribacteria bacterium]|tara:strand:- start:726 stop:1304 length:579 start_codon:yes stop_codon:yes gene_type:complete
MVGLNTKSMGSDGAFQAGGAHVVAEGGRTQIGWENVKFHSVDRLTHKSDPVDWCEAGVRAAAYGALEAAPMLFGMFSSKRYQLQATQHALWREPAEGVRDFAGNVTSLNIPGTASNVLFELPDRFGFKPALSLLPGNPNHGGAHAVVVPMSEPSHLKSESDNIVSPARKTRSGVRRALRQDPAAETQFKLAA